MPETDIRAPTGLGGAVLYNLKRGVVSSCCRNVDASARAIRTLA